MNGSACTKTVFALETVQKYNFISHVFDWNLPYTILLM